MPFSRDRRAVVYQRAKMALDVRPFGTHYDVYSDGYEWMAHSIAPRPVAKDPFRIMIGDTDCTQPYSASVLQHLGHELRLAQRQRHPGAERRRQEGRLRPRHRRRRLQPLSPRGRRRHHLGDRLGLFRRRNPDGTFSPEQFAAGRHQPAGQDGRAQAQPGRQARPWRRAAGAQGQPRDLADPRRADGRGLHLAVAAIRPSPRRSR